MRQARVSEYWLSAHIYSAGQIADVYGPLCDRLITEVAAPFARRALATGRVSKYFFVRYSEGGAHVRLRLQVRTPQTADVVRAELTAWLEAKVSRSRCWVRYIDYEPEYGRYGGADGVRLAESVFHATSEAAARLLAVSGTIQPGARLGRALAATLVLGEAFWPNRDDLGAFCATYAHEYLYTLVQDTDMRRNIEKSVKDKIGEQVGIRRAIVHDMWARLKEGRSLGGALDQLHAELRPLVEQLQRLDSRGQLELGAARSGRGDAITSIVPSFMHMTSNRIGVNPLEEVYLQSFLVETLAANVQA